MTLQSHLQYCKTKSSALMYLYFLFLKVFQKTLFSLADFMFNPVLVEMRSILKSRSHICVVQTTSQTRYFTQE